MKKGWVVLAWLCYIVAVGIPVKGAVGHVCTDAWHSEGRARD